MIIPFDAVFGGLSLVIFWGLILSIVWLRTHNPMITGLIGVAMSGSYIAGQGMITPEINQALGIGGVLLIFSLAISVYQVISSRIYSPPQ